MNEHTLLLRQAHPKFMDGAEITSQVFLPTLKDEGKLSVYDGDNVTAEAAHVHYTEVLQLASNSVWAVSTAESAAESLTASADPLENNPHHAQIDFSTLPSEANKRSAAKKLKGFAKARGCQFRPEAANAPGA